MQGIESRRLLPLITAVAAAFSITACGDRTDRPSGNTTTTATTPNTTSSPTNTAAPTTGTVMGTSTASTAGTAMGTSTGSTSGTLAAADREFFTLAASSDMLEMESGRLALDKSQNDNVRAFAQKMVDDHMKASENLRQAASSAGVTPPAAMSPAHTMHLEKLRGLSGTEFDREYAAQIGVAGYQEAVALFERASREAANADVRALAEKGLPGKREHLELGQTLAKNVGVGADRMKTAMAPPDLSSLSATIASGPNTAGATVSGATSDASAIGTTAVPSSSSTVTTAADTSLPATTANK